MQGTLHDTINSFIVPVDIFEVEGLTVYEQMTYIVLRSYVSARGGVAAPSYAEIAKAGRMSERQAINMVQSLVDKGLIQKSLQFKYSARGKRSKDTNKYTILAPGSAQHALGGGAHGAQGSAQHALGGGAHGAHQDLKRNDLKDLKRNDDDRDVIIFEIFEDFKDQINEDEYKEIVNRTKQFKTGCYRSYLITAVNTHIENKNAKTVVSKQKKNRTSKKPKLPIVESSREPQPPLTEEELTKFRETVKKIKGGKEIERTRSGKPKLPLVESQEPQPPLTEEELARLQETIKELKGMGV